MKVINEGSACTATVRFFNVSGAPYTPQSIQWKLTDTTNNRTVQDWTAFDGVLANTVEIDIPFTLNSIFVDRNTLENRVLTVQVDTNLPLLQFSDETLYKVRNLKGFK